jgi:predicted GIY-YIG superfamily endonuclease
MSPAFPNWFYVYVLESKRNGSIYVGCTSKHHGSALGHLKIRLKIPL